MDQKDSDKILSSINVKQKLDYQMFQIFNILMAL